MNSKDNIRPLFPKDFSNIIREGKATNQFTPGTLVRRTPGSNNDLVEKIDCTSLGTDFSDVPAGAEVVWTDMTTRFDADARPEYDHTASAGSRLSEYYKVTTVPDSFMADINISNLLDSNSQSPSGGDVLIKSTTEKGKLETVSDISGFVGGNADVEHSDFPGLQVAVVHSEGQESGFIRVKFDLG